MPVFILDAMRGGAAQVAIDRAIARADLVALVARRQHELVAIRLQRDDDVTDAQLKLAMAQAALDDFDRDGTEPDRIQRHEPI